MNKLLLSLGLVVGLSSTSLAGNLVSSMTWTEDGGYKMAQEDQVPIFVSTPSGYTGSYCSTCTTSRIWDGTNIKLFGAKGELLNFYTYLNAGVYPATNVMVTLSSFTGTGAATGYGFSAVAVSSTNVWDYSQRPYSLYVSSYVQILGMDLVGMAWDPSEYDEQQLPPRWRLPCTGGGTGSACTVYPNTLGTGSSVWTSRLDHSKHYPDAMVPIEEWTGVGSSFTIAAQQSQVVVGEVYISTSLVASATYWSTLSVYEGNVISTKIPVALYVYNVTLPSTPTLPTIGYVGMSDLSMRLTGNRSPANFNVDPYYTNALRVGAFLHRHRVTMIGNLEVSGRDFPSPIWLKFFDGSAYTTTYGLSPNTGNGYGVGDPIHVIGMYSTWTSAWNKTNTGGAGDFCTNMSSYTAWCVNNNVKCFLYTADDEASNAVLAGDVNNISTLLSTAPTCAYNGSRIQYAQTDGLPDIIANAPNVGAAWSASWMGASSATWASDEALWQSISTHSVGAYNSGIGVNSFLHTMEDGLGSREPYWGDWKTGQSLHFLWEINYWNDTNNGGQAQNGYNPNTNGDNNVWKLAKTFGADDYPTVSAYRNHTDNYHFNNGDGNILYPATDNVYPGDSYGFNGVVGSWRLNQLTRGSQDHDIIVQAYAISASSTTAIVNSIVQDVMYLRQCIDVNTYCSYSYGPRPWDQVENNYEKARESLLNIIASGASSSPTIALTTNAMTFNALVGNTPASQNVTVSNSGGGVLSWTATYGSAWLSISPASGGNSPTTMTVSVNTTGLTAGTYSDTITISASGASNTPQTISVTLYLATPALVGSYVGTSRFAGISTKN